MTRDNSKLSLAWDPYVVPFTSVSSIVSDMTDLIDLVFFPLTLDESFPLSFPLSFVIPN